MEYCSVTNIMKCPITFQHGCTKLMQPNIKCYILYVSICMKYLEWTNHGNRK